MRRKQHTHIFERLQDLPLGVRAEEHGDLLQGNFWNTGSPRGRLFLFYFSGVHNDVTTHVAITCVVSGVVVGVQELLHSQ